MFAADGAMPGIKGKRIPGRPGRFDPSEPLHMTTRRAAKTTNGSPSLNGSMDDDTSRRGSMDDLRPFTSHSNGSHVSVKSRSFSDDYVPAVTPEVQVNGHASPNSSILVKQEQEPSSPVARSPTPSRKRKRTTSPESSSGLQQDGTEATGSFGNGGAIVPYDDEIDSVELVQPEDLSDRDVPPSQATSDSREGDSARRDDALVAPSIDATPAVSGHVSPVTSDSEESDEEEDASHAKKLENAIAVVRAARTDADNDAEAQMDVDGNENVVDVLEDAEDNEEADEALRSEEDGKPLRGRFGGRRRAKHHIPRVERAMQRQSELKTAYRAIARAQKAVLAEIAQRTVDNLEANSALHLQAAEYEDIQAGLQTALDNRTCRLQAQHELNMVQLKRTLETQEHVIRATRMREMELLQDEFLDRLEYRMLEIARAAQINGKDADTDVGYETDDEDDVVPRPKGMRYKWQRTAGLEPKYDSRSRLGLDTRRKIADLESRFQMQKMLDELSDEDKPEESRRFTVASRARRDVAVERKHSVLNTKTLAEAASEIERLEELERATRMPVIPNEEALGLQLLGDLASRPSIVGSMPPVDGRKIEGSHSYVGKTPPRQPPSRLHLQTRYGPSSIPVDISPRTSQPLNGRLGNGPSQPMTPSHDPKASGRTTGPGRKEFHLSSPRSEHNDRTAYHPPSAKQINQQAESSQPFKGQNNQAPQDSKPNTIFSPRPSAFGERKTGFAQWNGFGDGRSPRQTPFHSDGPPRSLLNGLTGPPLAHSLSQERPGEGRQEQQGMPFGFLRGPTLERRELASQLGAVDMRGRRSSPPRSGGPERRPYFGAERSPARRWSLYAPGDRDNDSRPSQEQPKVKSAFPHKTSKAERGGTSRRAWSTAIAKQKNTGSSNKPGPASAISPVGTSFAGSPIDRTPAPWQQSAPPLRSPLGPPPPSVYGPPRPSSNHTSAFPATTRDMQRQGEPTSVWNNRIPPPSALYAVPGSQPPPPPGVPSEQFNRFGPLQPPNFSAPHTPQSAPGTSYGQQFGGPPIAPAMSQGLNQGGSRSNQPVPAFAQQQNSNNHNAGITAANRRRAQSDAAFSSKFQEWTPSQRR